MEGESHNRSKLVTRNSIAVHDIHKIKIMYISDGIMLAIISYMNKLIFFIAPFLF